MKASGIYEKRAQPPAKSFGQLQGSLGLPAGRSLFNLRVHRCLQKNALELGKSQLKREVQMNISQVTFFINLPKTGKENPPAGLPEKMLKPILSAYLNLKAFTF
ncbi:MAG: hypothetical protein PUE28_00600 [Lactobacillus porci]|nr:hypothetical protein [Lactobacillus porci]